MGGSTSTTKYQTNPHDTPPKTSHRLAFDPRSPSGEISRTPIQIDNQIPIPPLRLYNHAMSYISEPDIIIPEDNQRGEKMPVVDENEPKRSNGVEGVFDSTKVLTDLMEKSNEQLPPYQF